MPEDNIASIIASQYGAILEHVTACLSNDDKTWFLTYYKILCKTGFETRPGGMQTMDASKVRSIVTVMTMIDITACTGSALKQW